MNFEENIIKLYMIWHASALLFRWFFHYDMLCAYTLLSCKAAHKSELKYKAVIIVHK